MYAARGCCDPPKLEGWKDGTRAASRPHTHVGSLIGSGSTWLSFSSLCGIMRRLCSQKEEAERWSDDGWTAGRTSPCAHNEVHCDKHCFSPPSRLRDPQRRSSCAEASARMCFQTFPVCDLTATKQTAAASRRNPTVGIPLPLPRQGRGTSRYPAPQPRSCGTQLFPGHVSSTSPPFPRALPVPFHEAPMSSLFLTVSSPKPLCYNLSYFQLLSKLNSPKHSAGNGLSRSLQRTTRLALFTSTAGWEVFGKRHVEREELLHINTVSRFFSGRD